MGRKTDDRTYRNFVPFSEIADVSLRDVGQPLIVDQVSRLRIQKHARRDSLLQQFKSASGTNVGFPSEHDDGVGFFRMIEDQETRRLASERNEDREDEEES